MMGRAGQEQKQEAGQNETHVGQGLRQAAARRGSFVQTMKAVAWSFFGVRKSADHEKDVSQLNPIHVIIAGLLGALFFVAGLWWLVRWVVDSGVAQA